MLPRQEIFYEVRVFTINAFTDVKKDLNAFSAVNINRCYTCKYPMHQDDRRVSIGYESLPVKKKLLVPPSNKAARETPKNV